MRLKLLIPLFAFCKANNCDPNTTEEVINGLTACVDIDECSDGTHTCAAKAECDNKYAGYDCNCNPG